MKIVIFDPKKTFTIEQQKQLSSVGQIVYTKTKDELSVKNAINLAEGADVIALGPSVLGGFEKAKERLTQLMESLPNLKGVCLGTTSFGWIDLEYTKKRKISVTNVPGYSRESVAEHTIAMLLGLAKRIFVSDRATQKGKYEMIQGFELRGKTLGIIGLGSIGMATAELAKGIGMKVIAYTRTPKKMKKGVIIVNTVDRELVNEKDMAEALKSGKVDSYAYEGEDLVNTPLAKLENSIGLQGFGYYTKEALENLYRIWVNNIIATSKGKPQNRVV